MVVQKDPRFFNNALPEMIDIPEVPIGNMLKGAAIEYPDNCALIFHDVQISYKELYSESLKLANALHSLGYGKGDVIATYLPNSIQYVIAYYGIMLSGATYSPINPFNPANEVVYQLQDANVVAVIAHEKNKKSAVLFLFKEIIHRCHHANLLQLGCVLVACNAELSLRGLSDTTQLAL